MDLSFCAPLVKAKTTVKNKRPSQPFGRNRKLKRAVRHSHELPSCRHAMKSILDKFHSVVTF